MANMLNEARGIHIACRCCCDFRGDKDRRRRSARRIEKAQFARELRRGQL